MPEQTQPNQARILAQMLQSGVIAVGQGAQDKLREGMGAA